MNKTKLLIALLFISRWAAAQEVTQLPSADVESVHGPKAALLGLSYAYERALSSRITLSAELMLGSVLVKTQNTYDSRRAVTLAPIVTVEPRFYHNFLKRVNKGKNTANNSSNYLALSIDYVFGNTLTENVRLQRAFSVIPKWGMRRALGQQFFFETAIGVGARKPEYVQWEPTLGLDIKFGYALGRRTGQ